MPLGATKFMVITRKLIRTPGIVAHVGVSIKGALDALQQGGTVLVYDADGREEETDMAVASQFVTPTVIRSLRREAGGLICVTVPDEVRSRIGLPYIADVYRDASEFYPVLKHTVADDIPYDKTSPFSITVNHRDTYTGITDRDRALTISRFAQLVGEALRRENGWAPAAMGAQFRSPGHVPILNAADGLLTKRRGHTELTTCLVTMADLIPSATICEMLGDDGRALAKDDAKKYAERRNHVFLEGQDVSEAWRARSG